MSLYRCAACGSPNVIVENQKDGYSYVKGAIGTALLGVGGAVAGLNGKTKQVYKCPDCGLTLDDPMSQEMKLIIDSYVASGAKLNNVKINGIEIGYRELISKYRNVEINSIQSTFSTPEKAIPPQDIHDSPKLLSEEEIAAKEEEYWDASEAYKEKLEAWKKSASEEDKKRRAKWFERCAQIKKQLIEELEIEKKSFIVKHQENIKTLQREIKEKEEKLQQLGFFSFTKKSEIKKEILQCKSKLQKENEEISSVEDGYNLKIENIGNSQRLSDLSDKARIEIRKEIPIPKVPPKPQILLFYNCYGEAATSYEVGCAVIAKDVIRLMEEDDAGKVPITYLIDNCPALNGFDETYAKDVLLNYSDRLINDIYGDKVYLWGHLF